MRPGEQLVLTALAGEDRPGAPARAARAVLGDQPGGAVRALAVAVHGVAVPELAARRLDREVAVDGADRRQDRRVVGRLDAEPDQLEEARIDHIALVDLGRAAVFLVAAIGTSSIAFGGLSWALDASSAPAVAVERLGPAMGPAGALTLAPALASDPEVARPGRSGAAITLSGIPFYFYWRKAEGGKNTAS